MSEPLSSEPVSSSLPHEYGHYHEEYRKVGERWLISYRKLTRLRVDAPPDFFRFTKAL